MDALDHLIQLAQVKGEVNIRCLLQGDWQLQHQIEQPEMGIFHLLEEGECWLKFEDQTFHLQAGDLFFLPLEQPHLLSNQPTFKGQVAHFQGQQQGAFQLQQNGKMPDFKMFCGRFAYAKPAFLIDCLPAYLHLSLQQEVSKSLLQLFQQEANNAQLGSASIINALAEILFSHILRYAMQQELIAQGVLAGLLDKRLQEVLNQLIAKPAKNWNVQNLAQLANMSRANFMRVFQQKMGISPGRFINQLRLQKAALLLRKSQQSIVQIALEVGYQSEAHFSKAFKAIYALPPSLYRKG